MSGLTVKQAAFVEEYLKDFNATRAAERAGYGGNDSTLAATGSRLLTRPHVHAQLEKRLGELQVKPDQVFGKRKHRKACFVYLIEAANGLVKIGKTVDVESRFKRLSWASPVALELRGFIESSFADELEDELHAEFADKRVRGEWFALEEENIRDILSRHG